jgi:hypothetical protein
VLLVTAVGWAGAWSWALIARAVAMAGQLMPAAAAAALTDRLVPFTLVNPP